MTTKLLVKNLINYFIKTVFGIFLEGVLIFEYKFILDITARVNYQRHYLNLDIQELQNRLALLSQSCRKEIFINTFEENGIKFTMNG